MNFVKKLQKVTYDRYPKMVGEYDNSGNQQDKYSSLDKSIYFQLYFLHPHILDKNMEKKMSILYIVKIDVLFCTKYNHSNN